MIEVRLSLGVSRPGGSQTPTLAYREHHFISHGLLELNEDGFPIGDLGVL